MEYKLKFSADLISILHLTEIGLLDKTIENYEITITGGALQELKREKDEGEPEAVIILDFINRNKIKVETAGMLPDMDIYGLKEIESETISHFKARKTDIILTDDEMIRDNERILEIKIMSTPSLVLSLYMHKKITKEEAISALAALRRIKWFQDWIIDEAIRRVKLTSGAS